MADTMPIFCSCGSSSVQWDNNSNILRCTGCEAQRGSMVPPPSLNQQDPSQFSQHTPLPVHLMQQHLLQMASNVNQQLGQHIDAPPQPPAPMQRLPSQIDHNSLVAHQPGVPSQLRAHPMQQPSSQMAPNRNQQFPHQVGGFQQPTGSFQSSISTGFQQPTSSFETPPSTRQVNDSVMSKRKEPARSKKGWGNLEKSRGAIRDHRIQERNGRGGTQKPNHDQSPGRNDSHMSRRGRGQSVRPSTNGRNSQGGLPSQTHAHRAPAIEDRPRVPELATSGSMGVSEVTASNAITAIPNPALAASGSMRASNATPSDVITTIPDPELTASGRMEVSNAIAFNTITAVPSSILATSITTPSAPPSAYVEDEVAIQKKTVAESERTRLAREVAEITKREEEEKVKLRNILKDDT